MPKQLKQESRDALHYALNDKITRADLEIKKLTVTHEIDPNTKEIVWGEDVKKPYPEVLEKKIAGFRAQIENCQLSLRMVHNTGWIAEWRDEHIRGAKERLEKEYPDKIAAAKLEIDSEDPEIVKAAQKRLEGLELEEAALRSKIKNLTRAKNCNKKDCYGRGYVGFNISTGEYAFCSCTMKTKHYYSVNKSTD